MAYQINCTPAECVKLRRKHSVDELEWAAEVMAYYGCRPRAEDGDNLREFIADVFAAGRISGVREERKRKSRVVKFANVCEFESAGKRMKVLIFFTPGAPEERWAIILEAFARSLTGYTSSVIRREIESKT